MHKNLVGLIEAFSILRKSLPCRLTIVGMIPSKPIRGMYDAGQIQKIIEQRGLVNSVRVLGYVPDEVLEKLFAEVDVLVYPSLYEGFGLPVLEGMEQGVPVVISAHGALPEVAGDAAVRAEVEDAQAFAAVLERVLTNEDLQARLIQQGYERTKSFSDWRRVAAETLESYKKVADGETLPSTPTPEERN